MKMPRAAGSTSRALIVLGELVAVGCSETFTTPSALVEEKRQLANERDQSSVNTCVLGALPIMIIIGMPTVLRDPGNSKR